MSEAEAFFSSSSASSSSTPPPSPPLLRVLVTTIPLCSRLGATSRTNARRRRRRELSRISEQQLRFFVSSVLRLLGAVATSRDDWRETRQKRERRAQKQNENAPNSLSRSRSLLISPSYRLVLVLSLSLFACQMMMMMMMMMMMVQNCGGNNRTARSLCCFAGLARALLETFFFISFRVGFLNAKGEFERNLSQSFFSKCRLFRKTFPQSCHVCPFERDILLFFAFLFRTFFFRFFFSSLRIIHQRDSLFLYLCVYIYFFFNRTKELLTSCRCA